MEKNLQKKIGYIKHATSPVSRFLTDNEKKYINPTLLDWVDDNIYQLTSQRSGCGLSAIIATKNLNILGTMTIHQIYCEAAKITGNTCSLSDKN